jgi:hypothetical protein
MESLDLNINNYSINDIEKFFKLNSRKQYTAADIELKEYQIREQLLSSGHINKRFKKELIDFLESAKLWLTTVKCNTTAIKYQPTVIPSNYKLDTINTPLSKEPISRTNEITVKPETQFVYSNNSDFFPGVLNPLNTRIITKCLNIDSRFRENLYSTQCSDFTIQLPTKFSKVVSMQLAAIEFPVTFYGISSSYGNNFLYLNLNYDTSGTIIDTSCTIIDTSGTNVDTSNIFIIPDGNYTASDLISTMNKLFINASNPIFNSIDVSMNITLSGSGTGKITIGTNNSAIKSITLDFSKNINGQSDNVELFTKFGWNMGFIHPKYTGKTSYTADTILDPATIRYIYLAIDDFNNSSNNHFINVYNKSLISPDTLARISLKGSYFSLLMENDFIITSEPRLYFGPVDIQKLRIRIFDDMGRIIPMNNSNFSFCLNLKMVYDL